MRQNDTLQCANMVEPKKDNEQWRGEQIAFYSSPAWKNLREYIKKERGGLCEMCLRRGKYTAATLVHHIKPVTAENVNDPEITLNPENLMALCDDCHAAIHSTRRYTIDENGNVSAI